MANMTFNANLLPKTDQSFDLGSSSLRWNFYGDLTGDASTVNGHTVNKDVPANAVFTDTDTKQNITLGTTTKAFITGVSTTPTATAQALTGIADTGVYLTAAAGEISAARHSWNVSGTEKAYTVYNSTTDAIDFIFV